MPAVVTCPSSENRPTLKSLPSTTIGEEEIVRIAIDCSSLICQSRCLITSNVIGSIAGSGISQTFPKDHRVLRRARSPSPGRLFREGGSLRPRLYSITRFVADPHRRAKCDVSAVAEWRLPGLL